MGTFQSSQYMPLTVPDLEPVAGDVAQHFRARGFEVTTQRTIGGAWRVSLHKGNLFKAVIGMKTSLNIDLEPAAGGTQVTAGIGIFGKQVVPTIITLFLFWPVAVAQLWGIVQQGKLDEEAIRAAETSLKARAEQPGAPAPPGGAQAAGRFCTSCGHQLPAGSKFCIECGAKTAQANGIAPVRAGT